MGSNPLPFGQTSFGTTFWFVISIFAYSNLSTDTKVSIQVMYLTYAYIWRSKHVAMTWFNMIKPHIIWFNCRKKFIFALLIENRLYLLDIVPLQVLLSAFCPQYRFRSLLYEIVFENLHIGLLQLSSFDFFLKLFEWWLHLSFISMNSLSFSFYRNSLRISLSFLCIPQEN